MITARHGDKDAGKATKEMRCEPEREPRGGENGRCSEPGGTKAKPLGHQSGKPPGAAIAGGQSR